MLAGLPSAEKEACTFSRSPPVQTKEHAAGYPENLCASSTTVLSSGQALCFMRHRHRSARRGEKAFQNIAMGVDVQEERFLCSCACLAVHTSQASPP